MSTQQCEERLKEKGIPFVFLDSNIPEITPLAFFGQDSLKSGYFAGRIFMMQAGREARRILLMKLMSKGRVASRQQANREVGFRKYMAQHFPQCEIKELLLQIDGNEQYGPQIRDFLQGNPDIRHCITFCSRAYILGEYFRQNGLEDFHLFDDVNEYIALVVDYIQRLRPDLVLERFVSQSPKELLIAPDWGLKNYEFNHRLQKRMKELDAWQGKLYNQ